MMSLAFLDRPHTVIEGPFDVGVEQRWQVELEDGTRALAAQLAPDLARDESIRRRYLRDLRRTVDLGASALLPTLAIGPVQNGSDPNATPPWRLRAAPAATSLSDILERAPLGLEEFSSIFTRLADAVHQVHTAGAVLRDLRPSQVFLSSDGAVMLADIGLARVDVLSSHTASSLLLHGSEYAAPEQLYKTAVDQRSDVFSIGAMMYQALTGEHPYPGGSLFNREAQAVAPIATVRSDVSAELSTHVITCLAAEPSARPASVTETAWVLRGGTALDTAPEETLCQHCQAPLRVGQRLCMGCGREAVKFVHAQQGNEGWGLDLVSLSEDERPLRWLQDFIQRISQPPFFRPEFIIGSIHLYDDEERAGRLRLPTRLYSSLTEDTALSLQQAMKAARLKTRVIRPDAQKRAAFVVAATLLATALLAGVAALAGIHVAWVLVPGLVATIFPLAMLNNRISERRTAGRFQLRQAPAALPASDPLVRRLATLLDGEPPNDVHAVVGQLALVVQRLVDHRAAIYGSQHQEFDALTAPLEPLVTAVERQVEQVCSASRELEELEEGAMVRALAIADARNDGASRRDEILSGLDRLRALEDARASAFHRLLEVKSLLQRTVALGLGVQDADAQHERSIALAVATLGD